MTACRVAVVAALALTALAPAQPPAAAKVALVVGVNAYDNPGFSTLRHAERDATELARELRGQGFTVVLLLGSGRGDDRATRAAIEAKLLDLLKGVGRNGVALVSLAGHGQQLPVRRNGVTSDDAFYCPVDAVKGSPADLLSLSRLIDDVLAPRVGRKLVLVDACRDKPADPTRGSRGVQGGSVMLPADTAVLFSCSPGQRSFEDVRPDGLKHGLFTYSVLEGLRGRAAHDGEVSWADLVSYVERRMRQPDLRALMDADEPQEPIPSGNVGYTLLAKAGGVSPPPAVAVVPPEVKPPIKGERTSAPKPPVKGDPADPLKVQLGGGVVLELVRIPAGEFLMGSPAADADAYEDEQPQQRVRISKAFLMGKYEVTQEQYKAVMRENPSHFAATGVGAAAVADKDTRRFPVEKVSWDDARAFCGKIGRGARLPTEAEWEYACRANTTTRFHTGNTIFRLNANLGGGDGGQPCEVGRYQPNAFGLYDMHGNVYEWTADGAGRKLTATPITDPSFAGIATTKVIRGGSWYAGPQYARTAFRHGAMAAVRENSTGFRVLVPLE